MYDNTCRYLAEHFTTDIATWLLGAPIALTKLSPSELSLEPIRADALILLQSDTTLLHIEFQTGPDPDIPFRMLDYRVRGYRRFPNKRMVQFVVYLRKSDSPLVYQTRFRLSDTLHRFQVIRLWEQPHAPFLQSPGLLPFASLTRTQNRAALLQLVSQKIDAIANRKQQSDVAAAAGILAGLVLKKELIHRILRQDVMRESVIYQEIETSGIQKGRLEGKAEGKDEKAREVAVKMLKAGMALEQIASLTDLPLEQVQQLQQQQ